MNKTNKLSIDKKLIKSVIFGVVIGCLVTMIITLTASAAFLMSGKMPADILDYITLAFLGLGSFAGGYIAARIYKSAGIICGAAVGLIIFIIVFIAGMTDFSGGVGIITLLKFITVMLTAVVGGIPGVNKKDRIKL